MLTLDYRELSLKNLSRGLNANGVVQVTIPKRKGKKAIRILNRLEDCFESQGKNYFVKLFLSMKLLLIMFSLLFVDKPLRGIPGFYITYKPTFSLLDDNLLEFAKRK